MARKKKRGRRKNRGGAHGSSAANRGVKHARPAHVTPKVQSATPQEPEPGAPAGHAARLEIRFHGYWHPGTGRGDGASADAIVHRDEGALPFLPGRTVKGLLRNAVRLGIQAGVEGLNAESEEALFGSRLPDPPPTGSRSQSASDNRVRSLEEHRHKTRPGALLVRSARLGKTHDTRAQWITFARSEEGRDLLANLVTTLSSTALDESGMARDSSLRTIEVFVPVTLYADLQVLAPEPGAPTPDIPWGAIGQATQLFLRAAGSHRNRGLGRCTARIIQEAP